MDFAITRRTPESTSFRVEKLRGMFDLTPEHLSQTFTGTLLLPANWQIGAIVGRSGTGKSTIARELFGFFTPHYDNHPIIDEMSTDKTVEEITQTFTQVGFSSPPSWLKPYAVLSNGEKMRVDLAQALLSDISRICFDEFTSVVDRDVARVCSLAIAKAVRRGNKQFIAVSCHYDVLEFLQPDWIFSTDEMRMIRVGKKRGPLTLSFHRADISLWPRFRHYHYLDRTLNPSAQIFVACLWDKPVGFCAVLHQPNAHSRNLKRVSRLVVLPDYQGIGVGKALLEMVARHYTEQGFRMLITTSHPALNHSLKSPWRLRRQGRVASLGKTSKLPSFQQTSSIGRQTCSWEYLPATRTDMENHGSS